ncbi:hypothetical protein ACGFW5_13225 [Streptomyces sp. NPDC048416]|uniref:hypothetical protein n=1 Tax=Streptomyces sp. NPDC048416 TaxID=3365546 RepID=UPI00371D4F29
MHRFAVAAALSVLPLTLGMGASGASALTGANGTPASSATSGIDWPGVGTSPTSGIDWPATSRAASGIDWPGVGTSPKAGIDWPAAARPDAAGPGVTAGRVIDWP